MEMSIQTNKACVLLVFILPFLTGCNQNSGSDSSQNSNSLDINLATSLIDSAYGKMPCNNLHVKIDRPGPDVETANNWWKTEIASRSSFVKTEDYNYSPGNTASVRQSGYLQIDTLHSAVYKYEYFNNGSRTVRVNIDGCFAYPKATVLDRTVNPQNPKEITAIYTLSYPSIDGGPKYPPFFIDGSSYVRFPRMSEKRCTAKFNKLDSTGWELADLSCAPE